MRFLLAGDEQIDWVAAHLDLNWIENPTVRAIISARLRAQAEQSWSGVPALLSEFEDGAAHSLITGAVAEGVPMENLSQKIADNVWLLRNSFIDRQLGALIQKLAQPDLTHEEKVQIVQEQTRLRQLKKQPLEGPTA